MCKKLQAIWPPPPPPHGRNGRGPADRSGLLEAGEESSRGILPPPDPDHDLVLTALERQWNVPASMRGVVPRQAPPPPPPPPAASCQLPTFFPSFIAPHTPHPTPYTLDPRPFTPCLSCPVCLHTPPTPAWRSSVSDWRWGCSERNRPHPTLPSQGLGRPHPPQNPPGLWA
jgi:hypothetical protein